MADRSVGAWLRHALGGKGAAAGGPRIGMAVRTSEGVEVGTITAIWRGANATDGSRQEDTMEARPPAPEQGAALYVPVSAIARVEGETVALTVDGAQVAARGWRYRPGWLPRDEAAGTEAKTT